MQIFHAAMTIASFKYTFVCLQLRVIYSCMHASFDVALLGSSLAILLDVDVIVGLEGMDGLVGEFDTVQG